MESLWMLINLLDLSTISLILTAIAVTVGSAFRAVNFWKQIERNQDVFQPSTLERSHTLMIPIICSCTLLIIFYSSSSSISQIITGLFAIISLFSLYSILSSYIKHLTFRFGFTFTNPYRSRIHIIQSLLFLLSIAIVLLWLVSGHWILNNLLAISFCVNFVTYVRLPNLKICTMLLVCLFIYDVFWVFYSNRVFGESVMEAVAAQLASNPVHTIIENYSFTQSHLVTKRLKLPIVIMFPLNFSAPNNKYNVLGLGDMGVPAMLLAFVLCFDNQKKRDSINHSGFKYVWYIIAGYSFGIFATFLAGALTNSSQPALLYLVPCTLGPLIVISWMRKELAELWEGTVVSVDPKAQLIPV